MPELTRKIDLPGGGRLKISIVSPDPIRAEDYLILRPDAAVALTECLTDLANAFRPPDSPEFSLRSKTLPASE